MSRNLIIELAEIGVACLIMGVCATMMFLGVDSEVKTVFIMGATLAVRAGFTITTDIKNGIKAKKNGD